MKPDEDQISRHTMTSELCSRCDSSFETTSNPPEPQESYTAFGDTACGEPLCVQKLNLDFTPVDDIDNDFVQKKCCAFWDYLNTRTDLHYLMVMPEKKLYNSNPPSEAEPSSLVQEPLTEAGTDVKETTAVSMLEFVEEKGLIDRTFEAKLPQSMCSLGSREYRENELNIKFKPVPAKKEVCRCKGVCRSCNLAGPSHALPESSPEVQLMCNRLQEWDRKHPKSMDPPGHPPALIRSVMQRKVIT